jgi:hypothetical protein
MVRVIASYLPESMLITLESDLQLFPNANSPRVFGAQPGLVISFMNMLTIYTIFRR